MEMTDEQRKALYISASRGAAVPSRHRRDSSPGEEVVAGLCFDCEPIQTESSAPRRYTQVRTLEVEFAHWCRLFASRSQERVDLLKGLRVLREER